MLFHYSCSKIFVIPLYLLKNFHYSNIKKNHVSVKKIYLFRVQYNTIGANLGYLGYADFKASKAMRNYHNWQSSSLTRFPGITDLTHLGLDCDDQHGGSMISDYFMAVIHALAPFSILALAGCYVLLASQIEFFCYNNEQMLASRC